MRNRHRVCGSWLIALLFLFPTLFAETAMAQDTPPQTTTSPELDGLKRELERAKLEKELAEARQAVAVAERAEFDAQLPKTQTKGPEGSVTLQAGAGYFSEILAYRTLSETSQYVADLIDTKLTDSTNPNNLTKFTVILTDQFDLSVNDALWQLIDVKLKDFDGRFDATLARYQKADGTLNLVQAEAVPAALLAVPAILGAAADIAAFFRVNREIAGRTVTLSSRALLANMASAIIKKGNAVIIPALRIGGQGTLFSRLSDLQAKRRSLVTLRERIRDEIKPNPALVEQLGVELTAKRAELAKIKEKDPKDPGVSQIQEQIEAIDQKRADEGRRIARWKRVTDEIDPLIQEFNALETTLTSRPTGQSQSPLEAVATIDIIRSKGDEAKVLYVSVVSQGGEVEITKSAWTSGRISYVGGSVVSFFLMQGGPDGGIELAGTVPAHLADSFKGSMGAQGLK
jgi:hypothetical protein